MSIVQSPFKFHRLFGNTFHEHLTQTIRDIRPKDSGKLLSAVPDKALISVSDHSASIYCWSDGVTFG